MQEEPILCPHCGHQVGSRQSYCPSCGQFIRRATSQPDNQNSPIEQEPLITPWPRVDFILGVGSSWILLGIGFWAGWVEGTVAPCLIGGAVLALGAAFALRRWPRFARGLLIGVPVAVVVTIAVIVLWALGAFIACMRQTGV